MIILPQRQENTNDQPTRTNPHLRKRVGVPVTRAWYTHMTDLAPGFDATDFEPAPMKVRSAAFGVVARDEKPAGTTDVTLGLRLIRGPVRYVFMEPQVAMVPPLPTLVLLGDIHTDDFCTQTCAGEDPTCVSAQDRTRNTFLQHLDTVYGHLEPDVFLETWTPKDQRLGTAMAAKVTAEFMGGALRNFVLSAWPCSVRRGQARVDDKPLPCPYENLRVHVGDPRFAEFGPALFQDILNHAGYPFRKLQRKWADVFPRASASDIIRALLDPDPLKYFDDRTCLKYSRVSHELKRLDAAMFDMLRDQTREQMADYTKHIALARAQRGVSWPPYTPLFQRLQPDIEAWMEGEVPALDSVATAKLKVCVDDRLVFLTKSETMATDLYTTARLLKVRSNGTRSKLAVVYMGDFHIRSIGQLVSPLYVTRAAVKAPKHSPDPLKRCLVLDPAVIRSLVPDTSSAVAHERFTYAGPVEPSLYAGRRVTREDVVDAIMTSSISYVADALDGYGDGGGDDEEGTAYDPRDVRYGRRRPRRHARPFPEAIAAAIETGAPGIVARVVRAFPNFGMDPPIVDALATVVRRASPDWGTIKTIFGVVVRNEAEWNALLNAAARRGHARVLVQLMAKGLVGMQQVLDVLAPGVVADLVVEGALSFPVVVFLGTPGAIRASLARASDATLAQVSDKLLQATKLREDKLRVLLSEPRLQPSAEHLLAISESSPALVSDFVDMIASAHTHMHDALLHDLAAEIVDRKLETRHPYDGWLRVVDARLRHAKAPRRSDVFV